MLTDKKRLNWIDWCKVIGIFLVILGHFDFYDFNRLIFIFSFHMPLFFFISGFLYKKQNDLELSIVKDTKTLLLPYFLLNIVAFFILLPLYLYDEENILEVFRHILIIEYKAPASPCWFLISLFFIKIMMHFVLKKSNLIQICFVLCIMIFFKFFISILPEFRQFRIGSSFIAFPFFFMGYYSNKYLIFEKLKNKFFILLLLTILVITLSYTSFLNSIVNIQAVTMGNNSFLFYFNGLIGTFMIIMIGLLLNTLQLKFIYTISSGTILIMAFHFNKPNLIYRFFKLININIESSLFSDIVLSILIVAAFYYPIIIVKKYCPILIGNRR